MKHQLTTCVSCQRHVRMSDASCPFCKTTLDAKAAARVVPGPTSRMTRAAMFVFAATLATSACGDDDDSTGTHSGGAQGSSGNNGGVAGTAGTTGGKAGSAVAGTSNGGSAGNSGGTAGGGGVENGGSNPTGGPGGFGTGGAYGGPPATWGALALNPVHLGTWREGTQAAAHALAVRSAGPPRPPLRCAQEGTTGEPLRQAHALRAGRRRRTADGGRRSVDAGA